LPKGDRPPLARGLCMPSSKQNISFPHIDEGIYKAFALLIKRKKKYPKIADLIGNIDFKIFKQQQYRSRRYSYNSHLKTRLFMKVKDIRSDNEMKLYLRTHKCDRKKLGLKSTPDHTMLNYFKRNYIDEELDGQLEYAKRRIIEIAEELNIDFDLKKTSKVKRDKQKRFKNELNPTLFSLLKKTCRKIMKETTPFFPIKTAKNSIYGVNDHFELLLHMSQENDFAENASHTLRQEKKERREFCPNCYRPLYPLSDFSNIRRDDNFWICRNCGFEKRISPDADTILYNIKKGDVKRIQREFQILNEICWKYAQNAQRFKKPIMEFTVRCDVALDTTAWLTYPRHRKPDRNNRFFKGVKPERGTNWGYEFITLDIVEHGKRCTIMALPVLPCSNVKDLAEQLLIYARDQKISIDNLFADKGFFADDFRSMLDNLRINYLIPVKRDTEVKDLLEKTPVPAGYTDYHLGNQKTTFNMIIVKGKGCWDYHEDLKFAFSTNKKIMKDSDITEIAGMYPKRWGIETAYRIKKEDYLPKTTSKDFRVRLFYFLYTVLMYNLWFLADILVWLELHNEIGKYRIVKSKFFRAIFKMTISDPG
jgi:putative transposase